MKAKSNKRQMQLLILGCILVCLFTGLVHAQENWAYIYDNPTNPGNRDQQFNDIARNPVDGYIYCTGSVQNGYGVSNNMINVQKLNPVTGDTIWTYRHTPDPTNYYGEGFEIAFDDAGYIYVAGDYFGSAVARYMFAVIKLDTSGTLLHDDYYYHPTAHYSHKNRALSIYYGPDGYIYAAGYACADGLLYSYDFVVRKYDTSLTHIHTYILDEGSRDSTAARSVVVDLDRNVWAAGYTKTSGGYAFCVVQLDTALNQIGIYEKNGYSTQTDEAFKVCLPWSGTGAYACGFICNSGTAQDLFVVKLDATCGEAWSYSYPNSGEDKALALVSGPSNAVYTAGYTHASGQDENYTVQLIKPPLDSWIWTANGTMNSNDIARDINIDALGNYVYAAGQIRNTGQDYDIMVTKHSVHDTTLWVYEYDGPATEYDLIYSVDVAADGNLYVAGGIEKDAGYYMAGAISLPQNMPPTIPELISPADGGFLNDTTVTFTWYASEAVEPGASVNGYYLRYSTDPTFTTANSVFCTDTFKTRTLNDTIYYWQVRARDTKNSWSKYSDALSFSFDLQSPDTPVLISPIDGVILLDTDVPFEWGAVTFMGGPPAPVKYVLQVDTDDAFPTPVVEDTFDVDSVILNLPGDDFYYWRVKAYDLAENEGSYSGAESFIVDISEPLIDSTTVWNDTSYTGPFDVYTKVTDVSGVDNVVLYYKRMEHPSWFPVDMIGTYPWYFEEIPTVSQANDTVKYYIEARDNAGRISFDPEGAPTDYYWFIAGYTGVMDFDTPTVFSFGLKSNPAKGKAVFNLALPEAGIVTLRIYDVTGRLIDKVISGKQAAGHYEIPWTENVSSGIFFYHLDSPWQQKIGKLVLLK